MRPSSGRRIWPNHRSLRCLGRVYILGRPARDRTFSVGYFVLPWYVWDTADASHVECVKPSLAAIQQCAGNRNLCLHKQLGACPHSSRETSKSWSCLPNPLVDIGIQWEVVSDGGTQVGELADNIEFAVVDGNDRRCFCVLTQDIRLLKTDGQSEIITCLWEALHKWLEFLLGVGRNCYVISKQRVPDENLAYLCLGSESSEVEKPGIWSGTKLDSFSCCVEGMF